MISTQSDKAWATTSQSVLPHKNHFIDMSIAWGSAAAGAACDTKQKPRIAGSMLAACSDMQETPTAVAIALVWHRLLWKHTTSTQCYILGTSSGEPLVRACLSPFCGRLTTRGTVAALRYTVPVVASTCTICRRPPPAQQPKHPL